MKKLLSLTVCLLFVLSQMMAQLSVPSFFSDHMVLQREKPINIWGTASAGERISVTLGNAQKSTRTDKNGKWSVSLPPMQAGGPYTLNMKSPKQTFDELMYLPHIHWLSALKPFTEARKEVPV